MPRWPKNDDHYKIKVTNPHGCFDKEEMARVRSFWKPYRPYPRKCPVCNSWNRKDKVTGEPYCLYCYFKKKHEAIAEYKELHNKLPSKARIGKI